MACGKTEGGTAIVEDWLSSLKVGDQVCYQSRYRGYEIQKILKITPTGQIKTTGGLTFKNGSNKVDSWEWYTLEPITEHILRNLEHKELMRKLAVINFKALSNEQLKEILEIVQVKEAAP